MGMEKAALFIACLLMGFSLLPGGMAFWGEKLWIEGSVITGEWVVKASPSGPSPEASDGSEEACSKIELQDEADHGAAEKDGIGEDGEEEDIDDKHI